MVVIISTLFPVYVGALALVIILSVIFKMHLYAKNKKKKKEYQHQISRNHSRILKLDAHNEVLERKLAQLETIIPTNKYSFS